VLTFARFGNCQAIHVFAFRVCLKLSSIIGQNPEYFLIWTNDNNAPLFDAKYCIGLFSKQKERVGIMVCDKNRVCLKLSSIIGHKHSALTVKILPRSVVNTTSKWYQLTINAWRVLKAERVHFNDVCFVTNQMSFVFKVEKVCVWTVFL